MFGLALRALLLRRRTLGLALLPVAVGLVAAGIAVGAQPADLEGAYATLAADLLLSLVVALVALVLGVNAFDDEREGGTLPLLLATATPRGRIVGAKLVSAWLATVLVCLPAVLGCALLGARAAGGPGALSGAAQVWGSVLVAAVLSGAGYVAVFVLLSLVTGRSLLVGLAYVLVWEGLLATYATALRNLSVGAFGRRVLAGPWPDGAAPFEVADTGVAGAAVVLLAVSAVAALLAARRLPHLEASAISAA